MFARIALAGMAATAAALGPAHAGETLRLSVVSALPEAHTALGIFRNRFQAEINRRLAEAGESEVDWDGFHARTLSRYGGTLEAVEDELALFGIVAVNYETVRLPLQQLTFQMPFTTEDCGIVADAYRGVHETVEGVHDDVGKARQTLLAGIASDAYNLVAVHKIRNAGEVRGVHVGMSGRMEEWISGVGGLPVRLPDDVIGLRLADGSLSAALLPTTEIGRLALSLDAGHYTRTGFGAQVPYVVTVNTRLFEALPEAVRAAVRATVPGFVDAAADDYCAAGEAALAQILDHGVSTAKLLKSRRYQWAEALPAIAMRWARVHDAAGRPGSAAVAAYMDGLRDAGVSLARDWAAESATMSVDGPVIGADAMPKQPDEQPTDG